MTDSPKHFLYETLDFPYVYLIKVLDSLYNNITTTVMIYMKLS